MTYQIEFFEKSVKQLNKLPKDDQKRILAVLERIRIRPKSYLRRIVGSPYFKLRVGDYRLIIDLKEDILTIIVITLGHRSRIYKDVG